MVSRQNLQSVLEGILGSRNVYFQPPESVKLNYPAIVYSFKRPDTKFANNSIYNRMNAYQITLIDKSPTSNYVDSILALKYCSFDNNFVNDNLHHTVFTLYY